MNNVVGKTLVVLNLVFSLLFVCFAGAVYSFSQSWRSKALDAQSTIATLNQNIDELKSQQQEELETLKQESLAFKDRAETSEAMVTRLNTNINAIQGQLAQAQQQRDKHLADLQVAQAESKARILEAADLQRETKKLRDTIGEQISQIREKEDLNLTLSGKVAEASELLASSDEEIARLRDLCRQNKINPRQAVVGPVPADKTNVDGKVLATRQNESRSAELVHISIGEDDYVSEGMTMTVYRSGEYLGQIRIIDVYPDNAVGMVIEKTRSGVIARGDNVTTRI
ncbi:MAG: hypothetical protein KDA91_07305 [Planctomycetaceae bacterium]|nr:hypothetical protein [Planctomycetaceae bacterium]